MREKLPKGWILAQLGNLFDFVGGGTPDKNNPHYWGGEIPWATVKDIKGKYLFDTIDHITKEGLENSAANLTSEGDLILATRISPGVSVIAKDKIAINQDLKVVKHYAGMSSEYSYYLFNNIKKQICEVSSGTTVKGIRLNILHGISIPLPPLPEQHRIVAKIERLFSELDKGVTELKKAKQKLELYRQSLLKAAFEGRLTEEWRKEHADELESAKELLARIKAEREKRYQQQLEEWKQAVEEWENQGKSGKKPRKPRKPKELPPLTEEELARLPELPEGWAWVRLDEIGNLFSGQSPNTADVNILGIGIPYVTGPEQWNGKSVELNKWTTNPKKVVPDGCIFITVKGAGVGKIFPGIKSAIGRDISAYCPNNHLSFNFMLFALEYTIDEIISKATGDIPGLSRNHILEHVIALPSLLEQQKMAELLTNSYSVLDSFSQSITQPLQRAEALRQSILKKAFSGKLVPQDPNDEPASELLKRIKAEREKAAKAKKPARRARKKKEGKRVRDLLSALMQAGDWISAQEAFRQCGISDGAETDQIEPLYMELRNLVNSGKVIVERRGEEDWLKLKDS